jgi:hypothetical protein
MFAINNLGCKYFLTDTISLIPKFIEVQRICSKITKKNDTYTMASKAASQSS